MRWAGLERWLPSIALASGFLLIVVALWLAFDGGFASWDGGDALVSLPRASGPVEVARHTEARGGRSLEHVTLSDERLGNIGFVVSLPDPLPPGRLPVVVVLGGLGSGEANIRFIEEAGDNAIVGYDWPLPSALPKGLEAVSAIPSLRRQALAVPGQVSAMLRWIATQSWSDAGRISLLGFSLGAIAAPAAEHVAELEGVEIRCTVLGYGGVGLYRLVDGDQRLRPGWARPLVAAAVALLLHPIEPAAHLPHLTGHFLILGASQDTIVDSRSSAMLEELTPEPKTIIHIAGDHIGTGDRRRLLAEAMAATQQWLISEQAVNALAPR